ncbi:MAG: PAS domain-containing protein [Planctomicrobium sp.]|nr:PAS domain-containing protein [Planctomicrobium sp.]
MTGNQIGTRKSIAMSQYRKIVLLTFYTSLPVIVCGVLLLFQTQPNFLILSLLGVVAVATSTFMLFKRIEKETRTFAKNINSVEASLEKANLAASDIKGNSNDLLDSQHFAFRNLCEAVTERIRDLLESNQELSKRYSQFQSILARMSEGVLLLEAKGRNLYCNQFAGTLLGREPAEIEKKLLWEVVRTPGLELAIEESLASGKTLRKEFEIQRTHRIVEMSAVQLDSKSGAGLVIVLHDFTDLRRLEKLRREFVSNVSHELKTPLTSIQVYTDTLLEGGLEDTENNRCFVERIQEQSGRLQQLIQDMLRLARIEAQSEAFQMEPVSLCQTVADCVNARSAIAEARGITLSYQSNTEDSIKIIGDHEGVRTIFDNLINNALNYTTTEGEVEVHCSESDGLGVVEVKDNGVGIPQEHHSRIFERFYRVDQARSRGMGGTGLGLAIVKHCVSEFNGTIELESEVGQGTTFRVSFPLVKSGETFTVANP